LAFPGALFFDEGNGVVPPVLKHGPRSQTDAQGRSYFKYSLSYWKGELLAILGVHTKRMPNTNRPSRRLSLSVPVWTRKVVNYAWTGWSPGKPRWRSVAMLTCKSLARF